MNDEDLKDFFAAMALVGLLSSGAIGREAARDAYEHADFMLKEKNRAYPTATPEEVGIAAVVKRTRKKHGENG